MRLGYTDEQLEIVLPRQKELYEAVNPEAARGATGGRGNVTKFDFAKMAKSKKSPADRFTKDRDYCRRVFTMNIANIGRLAPPTAP